MNNRILDAHEVSEIFFSGKVSYWKVLAMHKQGELPGYKAGGRILFRWSDLESWERSQIHGTELHKTA